MTDKLDAIPGSTGRKIIDGLKDAAAGNFASVTIEGQRWVRADAPQASPCVMSDETKEGLGVAIAFFDNAIRKKKLAIAECKRDGQMRYVENLTSQLNSLERHQLLVQQVVTSHPRSAATSGEAVAFPGLHIDDLRETVIQYRACWEEGLDQAGAIAAGSENWDGSDHNIRGLNDVLDAFMRLSAAPPSPDAVRDQVDDMVAAWLDIDENTDPDDEAALRKFEEAFRDDCKRLVAASLSSAPVDEAAGDTKLLDALKHESWDLRCFDMPTGGGDADIGWRVIGHWQAKPQERIVGEAFHDDPRAAIRDAITRNQGQGGGPRS